MQPPSVSWHIIPQKVYKWNVICFGQKEPINVQFFRLLDALMKVHPIPHTIFETTRSGFIQIFHHCPVSWKITVHIIHTYIYMSSVHIFLGQDGWISNINLRTLWNHIMKNLRVNHGQCDSIILPWNNFFWRL